MGIILGDVDAIQTIPVLARAMREQGSVLFLHRNLLPNDKQMTNEDGQHSGIKLKQSTGAILKCNKAVPSGTALLVERTKVRRFAPTSQEISD